MLRWSINLFKVSGIQLAVHWTFFALLAYFGYDGWGDGGTVGACFNVGLIVLFFVCVILHEFGHALTARRYGVRTSRILLMPIGGMAEFDHIPRQPSAELLITVAGPAVNFVLAALLLPFAWRGLFGDNEIELYSAGGLVAQLCLANVLMGCFNLAPVFPMDGGRILRALLALKLPYLRATWWAVMVGRVLGVGAIAWALYADNYLRAALFAFIIFAGNMEYRFVLRREQEEAYWAEMARRVMLVTPPEAEPPLLISGRN